MSVNKAQGHNASSMLISTWGNAAYANVHVIKSFMRDRPLGSLDDANQGTHGVMAKLFLSVLVWVVMPLSSGYQRLPRGSVDG